MGCATLEHRIFHLIGCPGEIDEDDQMDLSEDSIASEDEPPAKRQKTSEDFDVPSVQHLQQLTKSLLMK